MPTVYLDPKVWGPHYWFFLHVGANKPIVAGTVPGSFKSSAISNDYGNN
jgi:hypothetical protein